MSTLTTSSGLLRRLRNPQDQEAWGIFVSLYARLITCWAQRATGNSADCEDLVQEFFLDLYHRVPSFEYNRSRRFRGWLQTQFRYVHLNWKRKRGRKLALEELGPELAVSPEQDRAEEKEYQQCLLLQAKNLIRPEFTDCTWQAFEQQLAGHKAAAVAQELGISKAAAYMAKSRVLARLRQELDGWLE